MSTVTWRRIEAKARERLANLSTQLESCTPEKLPRIQGEITGIKHVLGLPEALGNEENRRLSTD